MSTAAGSSTTTSGQPARASAASSPARAAARLERPPFPVGGRARRHRAGRGSTARGSPERPAPPAPSAAAAAAVARHARTSMPSGPVSPVASAREHRRFRVRPADVPIGHEAHPGLDLAGDRLRRPAPRPPPRDPRRTAARPQRRPRARPGPVRRPSRGARRRRASRTCHPILPARDAIQDPVRARTVAMDSLRRHAGHLPALRPAPARRLPAPGAALRGGHLRGPPSV